MKEKMRKTRNEYEKNRSRKKRITLRVTEEEYEMIFQDSKKLNLSMNDYILKRLYEGIVIIQDFENLSKLANAINRIGNNINQIARHANETGYLTKSDYKSIEDKMKEIHDLMLNTIRTNINIGESSQQRKRNMNRRFKEKEG